MTKTSRVLRGLKRKLSDANFGLNMGLTLATLTELEHVSWKLQSKNVTLPEGYCLISQKYHTFHPITQTPGRILLRSTKCSL
jgi:hypothetical protein